MTAAARSSPGLGPLSIAEIDRRRGELQRMRRVATLLLAAMAVAFVAASVGRARWPWLDPWLGAVRAFAEASMVGACADWFAVVALFRHPFGVPIPHTAIVPKNKARIGDTIGGFICNNFLAPPVVAQRLAGLDAAGWWARWLARPGNAARVARQSAALLRPALDLMDQADIHDALREVAQRSLGAVPVAPLAGRLLASAIDAGLLQPVADRLLDEMDGLLGRHGDVLRVQIAQHTSRWIPKWVDDKLAQRVLNGLHGSVAELRAPAHPWRADLETWAQDLSRRLATDPALIVGGERLKAELLASPHLGDMVERLWQALQAKLDAGVGGDEWLAVRAESALQSAARWIEGDPRLCATINGWTRRAVESVVVPHRDEIGAFIAGVVKRWDDQTLVGKIELQVGKDLQYIRINGTLVGGLVGLIIFLAEQLAAGLPPLGW